jgi:uncharacterized delta-60 repeat protein
MKPAMCNERQVRAAAGLTMVIGAVAFSYAYFTKLYIPLQIVASLFFVEFLARVTVGIRYSPIGVVASAMTLGQPPEWVSAKPKRFAWSLGLAMALAMTVITNVGIRGYLPRTICLICLTLMWMESALGLCLGCKIYGLLLRRGWIGTDPEIEVCADGSCEPRPARSHAPLGLTGLVLALSIGALLVAAVPAWAGKPLDTRPVRFWTVLKMTSTGETKVSSGHKRGGLLKKTVDLGPQAFLLEPILAPSRAIAEVLSTADGKHEHALAQAPTKNPDDPQSAMGSLTNLDLYQSFIKHSRDATLSVTISRVVLNVVDNNGGLGNACAERPCAPIVVSARFGAFGYVGRGYFFEKAGEADILGSDEGWQAFAAPNNYSHGLLWDGDSFGEQQSPVAANDVPEDRVNLVSPIRVTIPLSAVHRGELFAIHIQMSVEAADDRGDESAGQASLEDPPLLASHGLEARGKPRIREPRLAPPPAPRCSARPRPGAGVIALSQPTTPVAEGSRSAFVTVTRTGGSRGPASVNLSTTAGTATAGSDFTSTRTRVVFGNRDAAQRIVDIPIRQDNVLESSEKFTVSLSHARCAALGAAHSATVRIDDDEPRVVHPAPEFTIGGAVNGLEGSGLVLSDLRSQLPVSADGSFTFPVKRGVGESYEVQVAKQPQNPDQVCTVHHGTGKVTDADVTDVFVSCTTPPPTRGLDQSFGNGGKVSTPIGTFAQAEGVVVQSDGEIVTAGWGGSEIASDFALARYDDAGNLDPSFGHGGIVTTDLGGGRDRAMDVAIDRNGGIVAAGGSDAAGVQKNAFAVVDYLPDGRPNPDFGTNGIVTTPFFGKGALATAVAVQPDGKILAGGLAVSATGIDSDFALARYNTDGTLDTSFGAGGTITTDLGTLNDSALGLALQPDGKIVLAGDAEDNIALARYLPNGRPDPTFNNSGTTVSFRGAVNGVAITSGGTILLAGDTVGPHQTSDFMLASFGPNGKLNKGFGTGGAAITDVSGADDFAEDLAIAKDGRIFVVGRAITSPPFTDLAVVGYNPDGTVNTSFLADFHGRGEFGQDITFDAQDRLVAVGSTADGGNTEFALLRAFP